jgi:hypothetical protein
MDKGFKFYYEGIHEQCPSLFWTTLQAGVWLKVCPMDLLRGKFISANPEVTNKLNKRWFELVHKEGLLQSSNPSDLKKLTLFCNGRQIDILRVSSKFDFRHLKSSIPTILIVSIKTTYTISMVAPVSFTIVVSQFPMF